MKKRLRSTEPALASPTPPFFQRQRSPWWVAPPLLASTAIHVLLGLWIWERDLQEIRVAFEERPLVIESRFVPLPKVPPPPPPPPQFSERVDQLLATEAESPVTEEPPPEQRPEPANEAPLPTEQAPLPPLPEQRPEAPVAPPEASKPAPEPPPEPLLEAAPDEPQIEIEPKVPAQQTAEASSMVRLDYVPAFRYNPDPRYPPASLRRNEEGVVSLQVETDADGRVSNVQVVNSSGFPLLDRSAVVAISRWHCEPTEFNGQRVAASFIIDITFSLDLQP